MGFIKIHMHDLLANKKVALLGFGVIISLGVTVSIVLTVVDGQGSDNPLESYQDTPPAKTFSDSTTYTPSTDNILFFDSDTKDLAGYYKSITSSGDPYFGTAQRKQFLRLMNLPSFKKHSGYINIRISLAFDYLRFGDSAEAMKLLNEALIEEEENHPERIHLQEILEQLAVTALKHGELSNGTNQSAALVCVLPLTNTEGYDDSKSSKLAIEYLSRLLDMYPDDLKYRWLLNVAHMTLGTYPENVPEPFLISIFKDSIDYDFPIGRFQEIARKVGMDVANLAGGTIMDDFDNDGLLDIVTSTWDPGGELLFYHNDGDGSFSNSTEQAGLSGQLGGLNIVQTDYNNDGWLDIFVMRGGWLRSRGDMRVSLLRNNSDGTFSDVTKASKLARPAYPSQTSGWADYDNDGDLDLFSCNESEPESQFDSDIMKFPSQLFRNNGDGTFADVSKEAGVKNNRYCKGTVWGDYDSDGFTDLYVSNFGTPNRMYHNNGDGTFTDIALELKISEPLSSFSTWFWDYNNDGWLDLFVSGYGYKIQDVAADYLNVPHDGNRMRLYRNDGDGGFEDVTEQVGLYKVHLTMAANFGDLDNDGFLDFYLGTGYPSYDVLGPNIAYRNNSGESFTDVTFQAGLGHLHKGHGIAFGDLDRDGDQDIFSQMGGFYPGDGFPNALYENPGHGNHWVAIKLIGVKSNRAAIGAKIKLNLLMVDGTNREVYAWVSSGGSFGASSLEQHVGLGKVSEIESAEVIWPTSGLIQTFRNIPLDSRIQIVEGETTYKILNLPNFTLGSND